VIEICSEFGIPTTTATSLQSKQPNPTYLDSSRAQYRHLRTIKTLLYLSFNYIKIQFTAFLQAIAATGLLVPGIAATPIEERAPQELFDLWVDQNLLQLKFTGSANVEQCENLPSNFASVVSSGESKPGFRCTIWVQKDCKGTGFSFNDNPGAKTLPSWIDNKSNSWKCVKA
jgi:hypothetical protein